MKKKIKPSLRYQDTNTTDQTRRNKLPGVHALLLKKQTKKRSGGVFAQSSSPGTDGKNTTCADPLERLAFLALQS